jgi:hypothetical protein
MFKDKIIRLPINKTAALVANQSGCADEMTLEDKRDSLAKAISNIQREISGLPKNHAYRKELGIKKQQMQDDISSLNKQIKIQNVLDDDLNEYIIAACRRRFISTQWIEVLSEARAYKERAIKKINGEPL